MSLSSLSSLPSSITIKIRYNTDIRRFQLPTHDLTYHKLLKTCMTTFHVDKKIRISYKDEEGDMIVIGSTRELSTALIPPPTILHLTLSDPSIDESTIFINTTSLSPTPSTLSLTQPIDDIKYLSLETMSSQESKEIMIVTPVLKNEMSNISNISDVSFQSSTPSMTDTTVSTVNTPVTDSVVSVITPTVTATSPAVATTVSAPVTIPTATATATVDTTTAPATLTAATPTVVTFTRAFEDVMRMKAARDEFVKLTANAATTTTTPQNDTLLTQAIEAATDAFIRESIEQKHMPVLDHASASFDLTKSTTWSNVTATETKQEPIVAAPIPAVEAVVTPVPISVDVPTTVTSPSSVPAPSLSPSPSTISVPLPVAESITSPSSTAIVTSPTTSSNWFVDKLKTLFSSDKPIATTTATTTTAVPSTPTSTATSSPSEEDAEDAAIASALSRSQYLNDEEKKQHSASATPEPTNPISESIDDIKADSMSIRSFIGDNIEQPTHQHQHHELTPGIVTRILHTIHSSVHTDLSALISSQSASSLHDDDFPFTFSTSDFQSTHDAMIADVKQILTTYHEQKMEYLRKRECARVEAEAQREREAEQQRQEQRAREEAEAAEAARIATTRAQAEAEAAARAQAQAEADRIAQEQQQQQQAAAAVAASAPSIDVLIDSPEAARRHQEEELRVRMLALVQMGFTDATMNRRLLEQHGYNLGETIEWLLTNNAVALDVLAPVPAAVAPAPGAAPQPMRM